MSAHFDVTEYMRWREGKYARSAFKQRIDEILKNPMLVDDASKLLSFWKFAIGQREADKDIQDLIAWESGLRLTAKLRDARLSFEHVDDLYDIAFAFSALDHLDNWQSSALSQSENEKLNADVDHKWHLLKRRIERLQKSLLL